MKVGCSHGVSPVSGFGRMVVAAMCLPNRGEFVPVPLSRATPTHQAPCRGEMGVQAEEDRP